MKSQAASAEVHNIHSTNGNTWGKKRILGFPVNRVLTDVNKAKLELVPQLCWLGGFTVTHLAALESITPVDYKESS